MNVYKTYHTVVDRAVLVAIMVALTSVRAAAHHDTGSDGLRASAAMGPLRYSWTQGNPVAHRVAMVTRYQRLPAPPLASDSRASHQMAFDLQGIFTPYPWLALAVEVPTVLRIEGNDEVSAGIGDIRFSARSSPYLTSHRAAGATIMLTAPSGREQKGHGEGVVTSSVTGFFRQDFAERYSAMIELGLAWGWQKETNITLDVGASVSVQVFSVLFPYALVRTRSYLRSTQDGSSPLARLTNQGHQSGETHVVMGPGLAVRAATNLYFSLDVQVPVTVKRDMDVEATTGLQWIF